MADVNLQTGLLLKVCGTLVLGSAIVWVVRRFRMRPREPVPKDVVVHHQPSRGPFAPSLTPFSLKLETFLRMANVPYTNVHDSFKNRSSKGKMTWIEYNGEEIADSELCIDYIKDKFQVDVNSDYTPEQLASGFMVQKMVEDHLYWTLILYRYVYEGALRLSAYRSFSFLFRYMAKWKVLKDSKAHGIGRHSQNEVNALMTRDLENLSNYLGTKKFLLGEHPSQVDCSVFGMLSQFYWHGFGDPTEETIKKFPNLCQYCERMKTEFWPDWDKCITHGESGQTVK